MNTKKVLDHGFVRLVDNMGNDLSIARNARVSYDAEWRAGEDKGSDARLINYLYKNGHNTPFEAVTFTFDIKAPIFVLRQWHRHRTQCLSGDTKLKFARPCDGKPYWKTLKEVHDLWNAEPAPVKRPDKQKRSLQQYNRDRLSNMELYCIENNSEVTTTNIVDCWQSGVKQIYQIATKCGNEIKCSKDHRFLTESGWKTLENLELSDRILTVKKTAPHAVKELKPFTDKGISAEANGRRAFNGVSSMQIASIDKLGEEMTYDIEVSHEDHNFIANNFCTHNSYNELSARYRELPEEYYVPELEQITTQSEDNKQMRTDTIHEFAAELQQQIKYQNKASFASYHQLLKAGCPREIARSVLPVGTYSHMFATMNLHNLFKFLHERLHEHAQYEISVYAEAMLELIEPYVPVAVAAFQKNHSQ